MNGGNSHPSMKTRIILLHFLTEILVFLGTQPCLPEFCEQQLGTSSRLTETGQSAHLKGELACRASPSRKLALDYHQKDQRVHRTGPLVAQLMVLQTTLSIRMM